MRTPLVVIAGFARFADVPDLYHRAACRRVGVVATQWSDEIWLMA